VQEERKLRTREGSCRAAELSEAIETFRKRFSERNRRLNLKGIGLEAFLLWSACRIGTASLFLVWSAGRIGTSIGRRIGQESDSRRSFCDLARRLCYGHNGFAATFTTHVIAMPVLVDPS